MSNTKQTAVEWLAEQMMHPKIYNPYIEQAKQIEKEQIIESVNEALQDANLYESFRSIKSGEQYYKETYET